MTGEKSRKKKENHSNYNFNQKYSQYYFTFSACETNAKCSQRDLGGIVSKYKQEKSKLVEHCMVW